MIDRYKVGWVDRIVGDRAKYESWLMVERAVMAEQVRSQIVSDHVGRSLVHEMGSIVIDSNFVGLVKEEEGHCGHDVEAFLRVLGRKLGPEGNRWLHLALTASNVVDTAWALQFMRYVVTLRGKVASLRREILSVNTGERWVQGRTHGVPAIPTTWEHRLLLWASRLQRAERTLRQVAQDQSVGSLGGPVGRYSPWMTEEMATVVLNEVGLHTLASSQVVPRDVQANRAWSLVQVAQAIEFIALQIRLGVAIQEVSLQRDANIQGSTSMPHKVNPVEFEKLSGLARIARSNLQALLESEALWWERDISHSSVDRVAMNDLCHLVAYMVETFHDQWRTVVLRETPVNVDTFSLKQSLIVEEGITRKQADKQVNDMIQEI